MILIEQRCKRLKVLIANTVVCSVRKMLVQFSCYWRVKMHRVQCWWLEDRILAQCLRCVYTGFIWVYPSQISPNFTKKNPVELNLFSFKSSRFEKKFCKNSNNFCIWWLGCYTLLIWIGSYGSATVTGNHGGSHGSADVIKVSQSELNVALHLNKNSRSLTSVGITSKK